MLVDEARFSVWFSGLKSRIRLRHHVVFYMNMTWAFSNYIFGISLHYMTKLLFVSVFYIIIQYRPVRFYLLFLKIYFSIYIIIMIGDYVDRKRSWREREGGAGTLLNIHLYSLHLFDQKYSLIVKHFNYSLNEVSIWKFCWQNWILSILYPYYHNQFPFNMLICVHEMLFIIFNVENSCAFEIHVKTMINYIVFQDSLMIKSFFVSFFVWLLGE